MPARFRRLSVFGWLIVALAAASVETHAQDLEPRAFANTPVGLNFLIGGSCHEDSKSSALVIRLRALVLALS